MLNHWNRVEKTFLPIRSSAAIPQTLFISLPCTSLSLIREDERLRNYMILI